VGWPSVTLIQVILFRVPSPRAALQWKLSMASAHPKVTKNCFYPANAPIVIGMSR
jgi:hypothetical protein